MTHREAVAFIQHAVPKTGETWADIDTGTGVFAYAIAALLGSAGKVYAIDQKHPVLTEPLQVNRQELAPIVPIKGDFTQPLSLPALDGIVMANSLHYATHPEAVLPPLLSHLKPNGSFLLIEYDTQASNTWVPYPIDFLTWQQTAPLLGLSLPRKISSRKSVYGNGQLYAAYSTYQGT